MQAHSPIATVLHTNFSYCNRIVLSTLFISLLLASSCCWCRMPTEWACLLQPRLYLTHLIGIITASADHLLQHDFITDFDGSSGCGKKQIGQSPR
ncbi:hypothetical protein QTG54_014454 [Skeletonema marinoi]|uniref:Uncharacterized protein n=1 Tax=Skeletonema marinoi TaxID=267567 RepID=A0AAD8XW70_9STRA|nr:hypothetical protein QTG54_014454 [Skeletonema marinoi]